ncbi:hypothetical protein AB0395_21670 [Streptosporangium sp. NPDC051023]|uniref:hypothetical protein n=1 Tax=Streptosporangium sp. NPDC051023 TaxID=3155410 RepID=UPI00344B84E0
MFRRFVLIRLQDVSGVSGRGIVVHGVQFPDGVCAYRWHSDRRTTCVADGIDDIEAIHGHGGATVVHWLDGEDDPALDTVTALWDIERNHVLPVPDGSLRGPKEGERGSAAA